MHKYPAKDYNKEHMARCIGIGLPISKKDSIEICDFIRGKKISWIKEQLKKVIEIKKPIPIRKFNGDRGHKTKIGPGKYPKKAAGEILKLIEGVEANAQFKGLNTADLVLYHASANKGATQWRYGRQRRRKAKRTNITFIIKEGVSKDSRDKKPKQKPKTQTKEVKKEKK